MTIVYKKIHRREFHCPSWFSSNAHRVVTKLIGLNPSTRIMVAKLVETPWFKKSSISRLVAAPLAVAKDETGKEEEEEEEPKRLNAFHLISLSESFDLLPLFEQGGERREEGMRFMIREPASRVISWLEGVAARAAGHYQVTKSGSTGVWLKGKELGRIVVAAEIFAIASSVLVVVIQKDASDTIKYRSFCINELCLVLQDIVWAASNSQTTTAI